MFLLYNCLLTLLAPFWILWMLLRVRARKEAPNWSERQGQYDLTPRKDRRRIWIHAVSVGEVVAAVPILRELRVQLPDYELVVSVTTSSGFSTASELEKGLVDHLFYAPIDVARFALSAMQRVQPAVLAIMETELWYNLLWAAKSFDTKTLLINGRISEKSYRTSRHLKFFFRPLLRQVDSCLMQSEGDAGRIRGLGATTVEVLGNCKFDQAAADMDADKATWVKELGLDATKLTVVVGSTRGSNEERLVIDAIEEVGLDQINVVHAPRHLESVAGLKKSVFQRFGAVSLRSQSPTGPYVILDTYGELSHIYSIADIVVVGGGFEDLGGQNLLQPLAHRKPVLHGPHMANFRDIAEAAQAVGASQVCRSAEDLAVAINSLLSNPQERLKRGNAAAALVRENLGASARYAHAIAVASRANGV